MRAVNAGILSLVFSRRDARRAAPLPQSIATLADLTARLPAARAIGTSSARCMGRHGFNDGSPNCRERVNEAELFLYLLTGLLADSSRFDGGGESSETRLGRKVGQVVFALAR